MRISELSEQTGVPVATIKYYLREGLLPEGDKRTPRLTEYDERHVRRLGLLRILRDVGDVPVDGLKRLVAASETRGSVHDLFAVAADALAPTPPAAGPGRPETRAMADAIIQQAGWDRVREDSVDRDNLAATLELVGAFETHPRDPAEIAPYVAMADQLARHEIANLDGRKDRLGLLEEMVVGQVVFATVLTTLRRLAEEHHSHERFAEDQRD
ncbi:DNA-binding transcriptional MerR regulator [Nocardioides sp. BE266]|uniref:MerR family transcriptional regulator n=1 Tax=Nocardioides sp. BE266 TaxID=2817725 RepID=UPI00285C1391|nr:MerR family transcriptional regulator [Nocardioides sp. BE266]MDR7255182.1 DNA-binding transcriptional MerR regulator [Nocardioides sp. BE266]